MVPAKYPVTPSIVKWVPLVVDTDPVAAEWVGTLDGAAEEETATDADFDAVTNVDGTGTTALKEATALEETTEVELELATRAY